MEHVWTVFAERVITDKSSNQVSLIDAVEEIRIVFPAGPTRVFPVPFDGWFITLWVRSDVTRPEKGLMRVSFIGPAGEPIVAAKPEGEEVDLTEKLRIRLTTHMISVPSKGNGRYHYIVEQKLETQWVRVAKIPVDVTIEEEGPSQFDVLVTTPRARRKH